MSEQEAVWYYSQHGERKGPVALEVLKSAVTRNKVDLEKDLVWGPGLPNWVKVSEVPELQGLESAPAEAIPAPVKKEVKPLSTQPANVAVQPSAPVEEKPVKAVSKPVSPPATPTEDKPNPYETPNSIDDDNALAEAMAERRMQAGSGVGIGRVKYFVYPVLAFFLVGAIGSGVTKVFAVKAPELSGAAVVIIVVVALALSVYFVLARLANLGMSRLSIFWMLVPFMNFWLSWRLSACPGGYQEHRRLDTPGKIMSVLFGISLVSSILVFSSVMFTGASYYKKAADEAKRKVQMQQSDNLIDLSE